MGDTFGFFGLSNQYNYEYFFDSQYQKDSFTYEIANQTTVSFSYNLASVIIQTEVSPDNIFFALTKIGGLIGLAKLFSIFGFIHEYQFEKDLKKFHKDSGTTGNEEAKVVDKNEIWSYKAESVVEAKS